MAIQISQLPLASSVSGQTDYLVVCDEQERKLKKTSVQHASESTAFGVGSTNQYGHVKVIDSLGQAEPASGEALSARQGHILAQDLGQIEMNSNAAFNHQQGEYFIFIGQFVKCTAPIVPGNLIAIGTNVIAKSVGDILKDLNDRIDTTDANVQEVRSDVQEVRSDVESVDQYAHDVNNNLVTYEQSTNTEIRQLQNKTQGLQNRTEGLQNSLDRVTVRTWRLGFLIDPYTWDDINYFPDDYEDMENIEDPAEGELAFLFDSFDDNDNPIGAEIYEYRREDTGEPLRWESVGYYQYTGSAEEIIDAINDSEGSTYLKADKIKAGQLSPRQGPWWMDLLLGRFHLGGTDGYVDWNNQLSNQLVIKVNGFPLTGQDVSANINVHGHFRPNQVSAYRYPGYASIAIGDDIYIPSPPPGEGIYVLASNVPPSKQAKSFPLYYFNDEHPEQDPHFTMASISTTGNIEITNSQARMLAEFSSIYVCIDVIYTTT